MDIKVSLRDALRSEFCPSFSFFAEYKDFSFIAFLQLGAASAVRRHVDRHASHSVVHSGLFDEKFVCCRKMDLFFLLIRISYIFSRMHLVSSLAC